MYERKSRTVKMISAAIAVLCFCGGVFSAAWGLYAILTGSTAEAVSSGGGIGRFVYILSVYIMPVGILLSVAASFLSRVGLRCGSLEKHVKVICIIAAVSCLVAFVLWTFVL